MYDPLGGFFQVLIQKKIGCIFPVTIELGRKATTRYIQGNEKLPVKLLLQVLTIRKI